MKSPGYVTIIAAFFTSVMLFMAGTFVTYSVNVRTAARQTNEAVSAKFVAEAGLEKAVWGLNNLGNYTGETATNFGDGQFTTSVVNIDSTKKRITATGYVPSSGNPRASRTVKTEVSVNTMIVSFNYGIQTGNGGFSMGNNSIINGNISAGGTIIGSNGSQINGDAFSAGAGGRIEKVTVTGVAKAHTIKDCTVDGDAYYVVRTNCTVNGTAHPDSPDPEPAELPIGSEEINTWHEQALVGGTHSGNLTINSSTSLGPRKIQGNLVLGNSVTLTITGTIWVTGTISVGNGATIRLDPGYGSNSDAILADGVIALGNSAIFTPADAGSYILVLSEATGSAISIGNSANAVILYAPNGTISIGNNIQLKEITADQISLGNGSTLNYDTGMSSQSFSGGPGGSWAPITGTFVSE